MAGRLTEDALVERPALRLFADLGWGVASGFDETFGPGGMLGRDSQAEVVLVHRLRDALRSVNPGVPDATIETAIERLTENRSAMDRVRANRKVYRLLRDGTKVEAEVNGKRETVTVRYVHWGHVESNDWLAVSQLRATRKVVFPVQGWSEGSWRFCPGWRVWLAESRWCPACGNSR